MLSASDQRLLREPETSSLALPPPPLVWVVCVNLASVSCALPPPQTQPGRIEQWVSLYLISTIQGGILVVAS